MPFSSVTPRVLVVWFVIAVAIAAASQARAQGDCQPTFAGAAATDATCESDPPPFRLLNIAGRAIVQREDRALFGGFIIDGALPVRVIMRAIGTSLRSGNSALNGRLMNPMLELRGGSGELIAENDDWRSSPQADQIRATGLAPREDREAAIVATLQPGSYTAVVRGSGDSEGIGVIEIYDLQTSASAELANLAARAFVSTGDNVLIGGMIVQGGPAKGVLIRAIGSSLAEALPDALEDPTLELVNAEGMKIGENDDWREARNAAAIEATGAAPTHDKEAAILVALSPGPYTATVRGKNNGRGIGVIEIYRIQ